MQLSGAGQTEPRATMVVIVTGDWNPLKQRWKSPRRLWRLFGRSAATARRMAALPGVQWRPWSAVMPPLKVLPPAQRWGAARQERVKAGRRRAVSRY